MHSSVSYSKLSVDETADGRRSSESSIEFIPKNGWKRSIVFFAFILGTLITFFYMRYPTGHNFSTDHWDLESIVTNDAIGKEYITASDFADIITEYSFKNESSRPLWTWTCEETKNTKRCVRVLYSNTSSSSLQSLKTCNMICSETPVWPLPTGQKYFSKTLIPVYLGNLTLNIDESPSKEVSQYLQEAFTLMKADIFKETSINKNAVGLDVRIKVESDADPHLRLDTKENYNLVIKLENETLVANIKAQSFCGARHGLETLSQLVWYDNYLDSGVAFQHAIVEDAPKFIYRGLLLDTARQYFPVEDILRTVDAMSASKLNTFHWHATDSQSFPLKLDSVPQMALYGAYSFRQVYTAEDVRTIVHRARVRGIRVVIEVDAPAHVGRAWSWGNSSTLGDLAFCIEHDPWMGFCGEPPCGQLNPNNSHVYEILEKIYKEIIELTGVKDVFHLGGDEVNQGCWGKYMKTNSIMDTWFSFTQKSVQALQNANKGKLPQMTIIWSSKLTAGSMLNNMKDYTIQLWGGSKSTDMQRIPNMGIRSIISHIDAWYLDCGLGQWLGTNMACQPYRQWPLVYNHRPWANRKWNNVDGGTACMWTELLAPEGVDSRLWPRATALAERLWSDPPNTATADVYLRLDMQRERLVERGIRADVIWPRWCSQNPYECYVEK